MDEGVEGVDIGLVGRDGGGDGVVDSLARVGVVTLADDISNRHVRDGLCAVVGYTYADSVVLHIDAVAERCEYRLHSCVDGQLGRHMDGDGREVAGAALVAETEEVVGGVVEVLRGGAPLAGGSIAAGGVEGCRRGVAEPADGTAVDLRCGHLSPCAIGEGGVASDRSRGCVVRVDNRRGAGGRTCEIVGRMHVELVTAPAVEAHLDVKHRVGGIEIGDGVEGDCDWLTHGQAGSEDMSLDDRVGHGGYAEHVVSRVVGLICRVVGLGMEANLDRGACREVLKADILEGDGHLSLLEVAAGLVGLHLLGLQVIGRSEVDLGGESVVGGVVVGREGRVGDDHMDNLSVDNAEVGGYHDGVYLFLTGEEGAEVACDRGGLGLVTFEVGVPQHVGLGAATVVVEDGLDQYRVGLDVVGMERVGRHDGREDTHNGNVVREAFHLVCADGGCGNLRTDGAVDILDHVGVVLCLGDEVGLDEVEVVFGNEVGLFEERVDVTRVGGLQVGQRQAVGTPVGQFLAFGEVGVVVAGIDHVSAGDIEGVGVAEVGDDVVHHLHVVDVVDVVAADMEAARVGLGDAGVDAHGVVEDVEVGAALVNIDGGGVGHTAGSGGAVAADHVVDDEAAHLVETSDALKTYALLAAVLVIDEVNVVLLYHDDAVDGGELDTREAAAVDGDARLDAVRCDFEVGDRLQLKAAEPEVGEAVVAEDEGAIGGHCVDRLERVVAAVDGVVEHREAVNTAL